MGISVKAEVSKKNEYWLEKHRYYELKYFCFQYPIWKQAHASLDGLSKRPSDLAIFSKTNTVNDPTAKCAEAKLFYLERIVMVEQIAFQTDNSLASYILKGVTENRSYDYLKVNVDIPCCKDTYYQLYRKFFWLLNKTRK